MGVVRDIPALANVDSHPWQNKEQILFWPRLSPRSAAGGMQAVAARLHEVFAAQDAVTAPRLLNAILVDTAGPPRLSSHDRTPWHLHPGQ